MTIHLSKDQERFVHDAVRAGLYPSEDEVICDALDRLRQTIPAPAKKPGKAAKRPKPVSPKPKKPRTPAEVDQYMLEIGPLSQLPDTDADYDDPDDEPVAIR